MLPWGQREAGDDTAALEGPIKRDPGARQCYGAGINTMGELTQSVLGSG